MRTPGGRARCGFPDEWRAFELMVRWMIRDERPAAATFLPAGEREAFLDYYRGLPAPGDERALRRFVRALWWGETGFAARWIAARRSHRRVPEQVRVLDAGSGFGTHALLFAALGADVTGVDLRPDRVDAASRRLDFHRRRTGRTLPVRFRRADLTREWAGPYDLVWVYNALSHIDPPDEFLRRTVRHLHPDGLLVVSDINGAYRAHQRRLAALRTEVRQEYIAPDGERHSYAVERTFTPGELRHIVRESGLCPVHHELYWRGLGLLPHLLHETLRRLLRALPRIATVIARRQLIAATPAPTTVTAAETLADVLGTLSHTPPGVRLHLPGEPGVQA